MNKRLTAIAGGVLVIGLIVGGATWGQTQADSVPPIVQEVTNHGERLDNHEDRITNTEQDVSKLQNETNVAPSESRTVVREVITEPATEPLNNPAPDPQPEPEPEPIVITNVEQIPTGEGYNGENVDCRFTYSDGKTYQWHWKTVRYNQQKITSYNDKCDSNLIGSTYQSNLRN